MGDELRVPRGTRLQVAASAQLNPDVDLLDRLELVVVGDQPTWKREAVGELVAYHRARLQDMLTVPVDPQQDLETWETQEAPVEQSRKQLPQLKPRVDEADRKYQQLLDKFRTSSP